MGYGKVRHTFSTFGTAEKDTYGTAEKDTYGSAEKDTFGKWMSIMRNNLYIIYQI